MKFRKKSITIEAIQWNGKNEIDIVKLANGDAGLEFCDDFMENNPTVQIETLEGTMTANVGDWIIKGIMGEIYPCKNDIFEKTYDNL